MSIQRTVSTVDIQYTKLSPRPLAKYSDREIRFSGKDVVVRQTTIGWQAFRDLSKPAAEMEYFETGEEAIRWALEG